MVEQDSYESTRDGSVSHELEFGIGNKPDFKSDKIEGIIDSAANKLATSRELLNEEKHDKVFRTFLPEDFSAWPEDQRLPYLEAIGRLTGGSLLIDRYNDNKELFLYEIKRLADQLGDKRQEGVEAFAKIIGMYRALQRNTNTAGAMDRDCLQKINLLIVDFNKANNSTDAEKLINPLNLEVGRELIDFNKDRRELRLRTISSLEIDGEYGLVTVSGNSGEDEFEIADLNKKLLTGEIMFKDGENVFGGLQHFSKIAERIQRLSVGDKLTIDVTTPASEGQELREIVFKGSNIPELESRWGKAYVAFTHKFSADNPLVKIDFSIGGEIKSGVDFNSLRIV